MEWRVKHWDEGEAIREAVEAQFEAYVHYWLDGVRDDRHNAVFMNGTEQGKAVVQLGGPMGPMIEVEPDRLVKVENGPALSSFEPD